MTKPEDAERANAAYVQLCREHPALALELRNTDRDLVLNLHSMLGTLASRGRNARAVSSQLADGLDRGCYSRKTVGTLSRLLEAVANNGHDPVRLSHFLLHNFQLRGFTYSSFEAVAPAMEGLVKNGRDPQGFATTVGGCLLSRELNADSLKLMAPHLAATAKSGHDPSDLAETISKGLASGAVRTEHIDSVAGQLRRAYESANASGRDRFLVPQLFKYGFLNNHFTHRAVGPMAAHLERIAKAGQDPSPDAVQLSTWFERGALTEESLPDGLKLLGMKPSESERARLLHHAQEALKLGVPAGKIPGYLIEFAKRGHTPNAGLIHELHKATMKKRR